MANEKRLIDANDALERLKKAEKQMKVVSVCGCKAVPMDGVIDFVASRPTVDAVEVEDPELLKAIKLLIKQYAHSKASDYVHSPVAHALYHAWKQVDERRTDNG